MLLSTNWSNTYPVELYSDMFQWQPLKHVGI